MLGRWGATRLAERHPATGGAQQVVLCLWVLLEWWWQTADPPGG